MTLLEQLLDLAGSDLLRWGWRQDQAAVGEALFEQGDPADSLMVLQNGRVAILVDGVEVGEVRTGGTLGAAAALIEGQRRVGTAVAREPTTALRLPRAALLQAIQDPHPMGDWLLQAGLESGWKALEKKDAEIGRLAPARLLPAEEPGTLARLFDRMLAPGAPDPGPMLADIPRLSEVAEALAPALTPVRVPQGMALFHQGEAAETVYLVDSGALSIQRVAQGRGSEELAVLGPGSLLGAAALCGHGRRSASAIARSACWVHALDRATLDTLPLAVRRTVRRAMLVITHQQVQAANALAWEHRRPEDDFGRLVRAVGHLQGWQAGDPLTEYSVDLQVRVHEDGAAPLTRALAIWRKNPALRVLDSDPDAVHVMVRHGKGYLHHRFVQTLLTQVFGVQAHCPTPQRGLLGLAVASELALVALADQGNRGILPGHVAVPLPLGLEHEELARRVQALDLVAAHGHVLLPYSRFDVSTGAWTVEARPEGRVGPWLKGLRRNPPPDAPKLVLEPDVERWRWFPLPHEAAAWQRKALEGAQLVTFDPDLA